MSTKTSPSGWLHYTTLITQTIHIQHIRALFRSQRPFTFLLRMVALVVFLTIGARLAIPGADQRVGADFVNGLPLLNFIDTFILVGALSNVTPLAVGLLPMLIGASDLRFNRANNSTYEYVFIMRRIVASTVVMTLVVMGIWHVSGALRITSIPHFLLTFGLLWLGAWLAFVLDKWLLARIGGGLPAITFTMGLAAHIQAIPQGIFIALFVILFLLATLSVAYLNQREVPIKLVNLRSRQSFESTLHLVRSSFLMGLIYVVLVFAVSIPFLLAAQVFLPNSAHWASDVVIAASAIIISSAGLRSKVFSTATGFYSSGQSAAMLRNEYWAILPSQSQKLDTVGKMANYLLTEAHNATRTHFRLYGFWMLLFCVVDGVMSIANLPTILIVGPIGTMFTIVVCASVLMTAAMRVQLYVYSVNYADFWAQPAMLQPVRMVMQQITVDEFFERLLLLLPPDERDKYLVKYNLDRSPANKLRLLREILSIRLRDERTPIELLLFQTALKIVLSTVAAYVITLIAVPAVSFVMGEAVDSGARVDLFFFGVSIWLGLCGLWGVGGDIRETYQFWNRRDDPVDRALGDEDLMDKLIQHWTGETSPAVATSAKPPEAPAMPPAPPAPPAAPDGAVLKVSTSAAAPPPTTKSLPTRHSIPISIPSQFLVPRTNVMPVADVPGRDGGLTILASIVSYWLKSPTTSDIVKKELKPDSPAEDVTITIEEFQAYLLGKGLMAQVFENGTLPQIKALVAANYSVVLVTGARRHPRHTFKLRHGGQWDVPREIDPEPPPTEWSRIYSVVQGYMLDTLYILSPFRQINGRIPYYRIEPRWNECNQMMIVVAKPENADDIQQRMSPAALNPPVDAPAAPEIEPDSEEIEPEIGLDFADEPDLMPELD